MTLHELLDKPVADDRGRTSISGTTRKNAR